MLGKLSTSHSFRIEKKSSRVTTREPKVSVSQTIQEANEEDEKAEDFLKNSPFEKITTEEIQKLADTVKAKDNEFETFNCIIPLPVGVFWNRFFGDNAEYPCTQFYEGEGHKDMDMEKWHPDFKNGKLKIITSNRSFRR